MISCKDLTKVYPGQLVLDQFSCEFAQTGFYLLLGESGSGKTTFLNVLAGFLPFEGGTIQWGDQTFTGQVEGVEVEYITQDTFFVNFLSVMDNLRLISNKDAEIQRCLSQFGLGNKADQMPATLSGGERQRLAIIRALLSGKKVLLLDEPTAALDEGNKRAVFELLHQLRDQALVICSSHDPQAPDYADVVIPFSKVQNRNVDRLPLAPAKPKHPSPRPCKEKNLTPFLKQWFVSKDRNRKTRVLFAVFLVLSMCLCIFADLPQNKLDSSIEHLYKLNMFAVTTYGGQHWDDASPSSEGIAEVVLDYSASVPDGNENLDPNIPFRPTPPYSLQQNTLPFNKEAFRLADKIKYGTYFTKAEQVILSWEMAQALYPNNPEKMLGEYIEEEFYGLGKLRLEVVGIFDVFNETEVKYLNAIGVQMESGEDYNPLDYTNLYFINGKLTEQLEEDASFYSGSNQRRGYRVYFDSYQAMKDYYDQHYDVLHTDTVIADYSTIDVSLVFTFEMLFKVSLPVAVFMVLFAILFYVSLIKTEFVYNNRFVSVFEYAGYSKSKVINQFILLNIWELIRIEALATAMALAVTWIVNILNGKFLFVSFQIFSYNAVMIGAFLIFMILLAGISVNLLFRRVRVVSWYENLISNRDLI